MADASQLVTDFRRYADLVRAALNKTSACPSEAESATSLQVERGVLYPLALLDPRRNDFEPAERLIELSVSDRLPTMAIVDRSGHHRPVYRSLLVYSWLQAFGIVYETLPRPQFGRWEEALRIWCFLLEGELGQIDWPNGAMPAGRGSSATESVWMALALHVAGKIFVRDAWLDLASYSFGKLTQAQQAATPPGEGSAGGPFLQATPSDNPETHWYHELVLLHAAASYAVQAEDRTVAAAVARNAQWQSQETQPDHATTQPWALFAFIWNPSTRALADQILHNVSVQPPDSGISLMLLADALYCLELFIR